jgi:hypothetical protein
MSRRTHFFSNASRLTKGIRTARIPLADAEAACKICKLIGDLVRDEVLPQYEGNPWAMAMFARIQSGSDGWVLVDGEEGEEEEG